jgi:hypothetical protein
MPFGVTINLPSGQIFTNQVLLGGDKKPLGWAFGQSPRFPGLHPSVDLSCPMPEAQEKMRI